MRVEIIKAVTIDGQKLKVGRLIRSTKEKANEIREKYPEQTRVWINWPNKPKQYDSPLNIKSSKSDKK
jgi:hypothetical protein